MTEEEEKQEIQIQIQIHSPDEEQDEECQAEEDLELEPELESELENDFFGLNETKETDNVTVKDHNLSAKYFILKYAGLERSWNKF